MITTSESTKELFEAFSKAQGAVEDAVADNKVDVGRYKYSYADLRTVWNCCRKALAGNGLSVVQFPRADKCNVEVYTRLCHSSGQWMQGPPASTVSNDAMPQAVGSAITYLRRYSLAALMGIAVAEEDDDGGAGSGKDQTRQQSKSQKPAKPPPKPKPDGSAAEQAQREQYLKIAREKMQEICGVVHKGDSPEAIAEWRHNADVVLRYATGGGVSLENWEAGRDKGKMAEDVANLLVTALDGRNAQKVFDTAHAWVKDGAK